MTNRVHSERLLVSVLGVLTSTLTVTTTSFTTVQTMQAAVHSMQPQMLSQYSRQPPNGVSSSTAGPSILPTPPVGTRKRKRAQQVTISYSEVQEVDNDGRLRDVIIIEDTPPPTMSPAASLHGGYSASYQPPLYSAPIRTRARAAAEAQALSASSSSTILAPPAKKRKRDHEEVRALPGKKPLLSTHHAVPSAQSKAWDSRTAATSEDVSCSNRNLS